MYFREYDSPVGKLLLESDGENLTGLWMNREAPGKTDDLSLFDQVEQWLDAYFRGEERDMDFPLRPSGTEFQKTIWDLLLQIPFGQTCSYGFLARQAAEILGKEKMSAQAVGGAVGRNPISILIPCHRVVGASGALTGYAGGLEKKKWLLDHECSREENI